MVTNEDMIGDFKRWYHTTHMNKHRICPFYYYMSREYGVPIGDFLKHKSSATNLFDMCMPQWGAYCDLCAEITGYSQSIENDTFHHCPCAALGRLEVRVRVKKWLLTL